MLLDFPAMFDALQEPAIRHAAMVHLPIAFSALGAVLVVALLLTGGRSQWLRSMAAILYLVAGALAFMTAMSGEDALEQLAPARTEAFSQRIDAHEWLGEWAWTPLTATFVLICLSFFRSLGLRVTFLSLSLMASVLCVAWVGLTAHHGGQLVYAHGAGVSAPAAAPPPASPPADVPAPPAPEPIPQPAPEPAPKPTAPPEAPMPPQE